MKSFEWTNPASVSEAVKMLTVASGDIDDAPRPIAGGQDLLTTMKDYTSRPVRVVNLKNIRGLNQIKVNGRGLAIGALVTLSELEEHADVRKSFPGLAEAAAPGARQGDPKAARCQEELSAHQAPAGGTTTGRPQASQRTAPGSSAPVCSVPSTPKMVRIRAFGSDAKVNAPDVPENVPRAFAA